MKPIRIVKRKRSANASETTTESAKPDEPSTSKIVNTVKGWIAESQERKPKLTRDGQLVPYMNWQSYETRYAKRDHMCEKENLPEPVMLRPNEPTVADWFVLVNDRTEDGADAWYDTVPAGKYELTIQRRLACCDGPMVESNKISFEVVP